MPCGAIVEPSDEGEQHHTMPPTMSPYPFDPAAAHMRMLPQTMAVVVEGLASSERLLPRFLKVIDQDGDEGSVQAIRFRRGAHHGADLPEVL
jgi:hypothetical protein